MDIETGKSHGLVFTFLFLVHGSVSNFNLSREEDEIFKNCHLYTKANDFECVFDNTDYMNIRKKLEKDVVSVRNIIMEGDSTDSFFPEKVQLRELASITFDKNFGIHNENEDLGIIMISSHNKDGKYMGRFKGNLLNVEKLNEFAGRNTIDYSKMELFPNGKLIKKIKMSEIVKIIKNSLGKNNEFHLIDGSCNINRTGKKPRFYNMQEKDIETGKGRKSKRTKKQRKRKSIHKKKV